MHESIGGKETQLALAKFAVIAPLICRTLQHGDSPLVRRDILASIHEFPDGKHRMVAERTLRQWLAQYRKAGLEGLKRAPSGKRGQLTAISKQTLERAKELRLEVPSRSVRRIMEMLKSEGCTLTFSKTTLNRCLREAGLTRRSTKDISGTYQRWQQATANDL
jgi:transposase